MMQGRLVHHSETPLRYLVRPENPPVETGPAR